MLSKSMAKLALALCLALVLIPAAAFAASGEKVVVMAITSPWDKLMPYNITGLYGDAIFDQIFERLVFTSHGGEITPRLATSWSANADHTTMTFKLNEKARWHDGTPVTAEDCAFTIRLVTNPKVSINRRVWFAILAGTDDTGVAADPNAVGVKAVDKGTVAFTFKKSLDPNTFLQLVNQYYYVLPSHILGKVAPEEMDKNEYFLNPKVGAGAFKIDKIVPGDRVEFAANKDYYLGAPKIDRLVIRVFQPASITAGLMTGDIDVLAGGNIGAVPLSDWETIKAQPNLVAKAIRGYGYQYMAINCQAPYLQDKRIRQAINIAINKTVIVNQLLKGAGSIAAGPLPAYHPYYNKSLKVEYDVAKAKKLLKDAKWDSSRVLTLSVPQGNQIREKSAPLIQQDLAKIGIKTKIQIVDFPTHVLYLREGKVDLGLLGGSGSLDPDDSRVLVIPGGLQNFARYPDQDLADLAIPGSQQKSFEERLPYYQKMQALYQDKVPYVWLYFQDSLAAHSKRLTGVKLENQIWVAWQAYLWDIVN